MKKKFYNSVRSFLLIFFVVVLVLSTGSNAAYAYKNIRKNAVPLLQQVVEVSGKIQEKDPSSGNSKPVPNATIRVVGTNQTSKADGNGNFNLKIKTGETLLFSAIGYSAQRVKITEARSNLIITLSQESSNLDEVVVTGFQKIEKSKFSGAAVKLKGDDIKIQGQVDVTRMLEGRAPGVSIQNVSGTFGTAPKIRIRGATSLTGDNKPLFVVDGVVIEEVVNISNDQLSSGDPATLIGSALAGINANDIETIDILKDAEATGLYGARAMNGVVVISTKRGKIGAFSVNYSSTFSTQLKPTYSDFSIMNSGDQISFYNELANKGQLNYASVSNSDSWGPYGKMYQLIDTYNATNGKFGIANTNEARDAYLRKAAGYNTDWFDVLFKNQLIQEHNISFNSGSEKVRNYTSVSYYGDNGWTIADKVSRITFNMRNDFTLSKKLTAGILAVGSYRDQFTPGAQNRVNNQVNGTIARDFEINPFNYALNTSRAVRPYDDDGNLEYYARNYAPFNIIKELQENKLRIGAMDAKLQGNLNYKILDKPDENAPKLDFDFLGAIRFVRTTQEALVSENSNMAEAYRFAPNTIIRNANRYLYKNPDFPNLLPEIVLPEGGFYNRNENNLRSFDIRNSLNFEKKIGDKFSTRAIVGQQIRYTERQAYSSQGVGYQYDRGGVPFVVPNFLKKNIEQNNYYYSLLPSNERYAAFFANASASYDDKYNLTANFRYDGGNLTGKSATARWLPTWSLGGSWNFMKESFMKNVKFISNGKLRASYGLVASIGRASNSSPVIVSSVSIRPYIDEKETVLTNTQLENSELTWEKAYSSNIGLDLSFLNNRISLTTDIYQRKSFDLISNIRVSGIGGQSVKNANVADLVNKGIEVSLSVTPFREKDWEWSFNMNFSSNVSKITRAENYPNIFGLIQPEGGILQGYPVRSIFSIDFVKLNPNTGVPLFIDETGQIANNVYFQSLETKYLHYEGTVDPITTGGFSNTVRWKNLSFSALITFQLGNKIKLPPIYAPKYSDYAAVPNEFKDRFVLSGDNAYTHIPGVLDAYQANSLGDSYPYSVYNYVNFRVVDGSFARMKSMQLSYTFDKKLIEKFKMGSAQVSFTGSNMFLLFSDKNLRGQDPETFNSGGVTQPLAKTYSLTLKLGF